MGTLGEMSRPAVARAVAADRLELLDWKRRVFDLYREIRADPDPMRAWGRWRGVRDDLIARHPQSPLDVPDVSRSGPAYYDYDPGLALVRGRRAGEPADANVPMSRSRNAHFTHFGNAIFALSAEAVRLAPLLARRLRRRHVPLVHRRDQRRGDLWCGALSPRHGQGCGSRGLGGRLVLDFNFAFNPSCAYDARWACPLAPPENRLLLRGACRESESRAVSGEGRT